MVLGFGRSGAVSVLRAIVRSERGVLRKLRVREILGRGRALFVTGQFEPAASLFGVPLPPQHPCVDFRQAGTSAAVVTDFFDAAVVNASPVADTLVTQFEPPASLFRTKEPAQQPCREDKHNAAAFVFVVRLVSGALTLLVLELIMGIVVV